MRSGAGAPEFEIERCGRDIRFGSAAKLAPRLEIASSDSGRDFQMPGGEILGLGSDFRMRFALLLTLSLSGIQAADWPMWRFDEGRTAATDQQLPENIDLIWSRQLPALEPAYRDVRLQFDRGYEPIVLGKRLFLGSSHDDSVTAFDTDSGEQIWKFETGGPVRFAPVGGQGRVIFGSDDGFVYCVRASSGELVWKFKAVPSNRRLIGNGRLISVWPVRGGPVLRDNRVYFAAGVWPLEGVFVYCLDASTGEVVWLNDSTSYIYGQHPHDTEAYGGLAPQGYLLVENEDLIVPSSSAYPARFDLETGELKEFDLPSAGRLPGGWFAATPPDKDKRRGLVFDSEVNQKRHEDRPRSEGDPEIRTTIRAGDRELKFADGFAGVEGEVHTMIAADSKLFVVTLDGRIFCFGEPPSKEPARHFPLPDSEPAENARARQLLAETGAKHGYALVIGREDEPDFAATLAQNSNLKVETIFAAEVDGLPPYFADLIVLPDDADEQMAEQVRESLRPYGGVLAGAKNLPVFRREGGLEGSTNYLGDWEMSEDLLVKAPLGLLWFGDEVSHFKRAPQPKFIDGVMVSVDKDWTDASTRGGGVDYRLLDPLFSDVYTGRKFAADEVPVLRQSFSEIDQKTIQPSQYRPPRQKNDWKPEPPKNGVRINPITGEEEVRAFPKMYGCDGGFDYGKLFTMRSGTAAFYDQTIESGTVNISGPRSGCTNSVIPANGVLNVPYFYEGCTCSYPLPMALALVSMPETFEQWMSWGETPAEQLLGKIERLGLNFGAPGDRKTEDGTLWLDYPNVGGPSPEIRVATAPAEPSFFYRHSVFVREGGEGWPWVAASGVRDLKSLKVEGFKPGTYEIRLIFAAPEGEAGLEFDFGLTGELSETIRLEEAMTPVTKKLSGVEIGDDGVLTLEFSDGAILCGLEAIRKKS